MAHTALLLALLTACGQVRAAADDAGADAAIEPDAAAEPDAEPALACGPAFSPDDLFAGGGVTVTESFESSPVAPGTFDSCFGPLSSSTSAPCASPGAVVVGFVLSDDFAEAAIYGDGFVPGAFGRWSGPNQPGRSLEVRFTQPHARVGFDLVTDISGTVSVTSFDEDNVVIATSQLSVNTGMPRFTGSVCNKSAIARVVVGFGTGLVLIDQLSFDAGD